jgi:hypothetical protein
MTDEAVAGPNRIVHVTVPELPAGGKEHVPFVIPTEMKFIPAGRASVTVTSSLSVVPL